MAGEILYFIHRHFRLLTVMAGVGAAGPLVRFGSALLGHGHV